LPVLDIFPIQVAVSVPVTGFSTIQACIPKFGKEGIGMAFSMENLDKGADDC
jgi:hypothetical protein